MRGVYYTSKAEDLNDDEGYTCPNIPRRMLRSVYLNKPIFRTCLLTIDTEETILGRHRNRRAVDE